MFIRMILGVPNRIRKFAPSDPYRIHRPHPRILSSPEEFVRSPPRTPFHNTLRARLRDTSLKSYLKSQDAILAQELTDDAVVPPVGG